ncbi:protein of unknown function [Candidatus Promineifilum breve]|uniref:Uncharacterized protein n=1 Tax=Candidatus Promineifilum breve TaxID=1806508 RepID=A0A160T9W9_9CHLR|nr:protein of unknown function [Candidatus Promineifilum breve]
MRLVGTYFLQLGIRNYELGMKNALFIPNS